MLVLTFPLTKQIDFTCTNLAVSGSLDGYADGTKGAGSAITGWTIDWNTTGLTYSRTATSNVSSTYIPGYSTNNTISSSPASYVTSTLYDWSTVGSSQSVTVNELVDIVSRVAGITLKKKYNLNAPKGVPGRNSDNTLIKSIYGWEPQVSLEEGLKQTYSWIYNQVLASNI